MKRLLLVGAGHAHLQVLEALRKARPRVEATLVTPERIGWYSGMLPGVVAGTRSASEATVDVERLCEAACVRLVLDRVTTVETANRLVRVGTQEFPYDLLSLDVGSEQGGLHVPGVREHAVPLRLIHSLVARLGPLEGGAVLLVGGGPAAVELALALRRRGAAVRIVEQAPRILGSFAAGVRRRAEQALANAGVEVVTGVEIEQVDATGACGAGRRFDADRVLWATAPVAPGWLRETDLPLDSGGFVRVSSKLEALGRPGVFAAGDCCAIEGLALPRAGVHAVRGGAVLATNLLASLDGRPLGAYRPRRRVLLLLSTADGAAIASWGGLSASGRWLGRLKNRIDRAWMARFRL
jgi:selenide, water dikinase